MSDGTATEGHPSRPHLENSRPIRWDRIAISQAAMDPLGALLGELEGQEERDRRRRADDQERLEASLEAVVLDLFWSSIEDPARFLAYPRRTADYGPNLTPARITATPAIAVADFLVARGYASGHLGSYSRRSAPFGGQDVGRGYRSRLRATDKLIALLNQHGVTRDSIGSAPLETTIRLRGPAPYRNASKPLLTFRETPAVAAMRLRVTQANTLRATVGLSLDRPGLPLVGPEALDDPEADRDEWVDPSDHSAIQLYRVFNNARWDQGGRFYGGWWQRCSRPDRTRILIDGEETVELDYKAFQPRLCYDLDGLQLGPDHDPHMIPGYSVEYRDAAKRTFGRLLNSGPEAKLGRPKELEGLFARPKDFSAFVRAMEARYAPVARWLRAGRGLEMQFIDSQIADEVIARMTAQGVPVLPVHDSFIVPRSAEVPLGLAMIEAYRGQLRERTGTAPLPIISGWTSGHVARSVQEQLPSAIS